MDRTWSDRWHRGFPAAFFCATGACAFGFVGDITDWTLDPVVITLLVIPLAAVIWAVLMALLFPPLALVSALVGAVLDGAQRRRRRT